MYTQPDKNYFSSLQTTVRKLVERNINMVVGNIYKKAHQLKRRLLAAVVYYGCV